MGAELELTLGHKLDPRWGDTGTFKGTVEKLTDGKFTFTGGQWEGFEDTMGPTAIFTMGSIKVLIASRATYDWATEQFDSVQLDPHEAKFIVAKNPMNYRQAYGDFATAVIVLDTPGPTPATLKHVDFKKLQRPYFPADPDVELEPRLLV